MNNTEDDKPGSLKRMVSQHIAERLPGELALGSLRFEALRKLHPRQYAELHKRNLAGERFDDMVDDLVLANDDQAERPERERQKRMNNTATIENQDARSGSLERMVRAQFP